MNDAGTLPRHMLDIRELTVEAFAPFGQIITPLPNGRPGRRDPLRPEAAAGEAKLVLDNGEPRLWACIRNVPYNVNDIERNSRLSHDCAHCQDSVFVSGSQS
jgi:hypothetical protein